MTENEEFEFRARAEKETAKPVLGQDAQRFIPGHTPYTPPPAEPEASFLDKAKGVGEAGLSMASSIPATIAGGAAGIFRAATGGQIGTQEGVQDAAGHAGAVSSALTYEPRTAKGKEYLGDVGDIVNESKIAGLNPATAMTAGSMRAKPGALGRAGKAIVESPEADLLKSSVGKVKGALTPNIDAEKLKLATRAQEMGISLRPDMLTDNKILRMMGEALEKVPAAGSKAEQRQVAFNNALGQLIGADKGAKKITPGVFDRAMNQSGKAIGDISSKTPVPMDAEFKGAIMGQLENAVNYETADVQKVISSYIKEINSKGDVIPGEAFRKVNSKLGAQARRTQNGDLKHALYELQSDLHDALERNLSGADLATLQSARKQYAIGKTIEDLVAKSKDGDISPARLMSAVTSDKSKKTMMARGRGGDLGELAKIGQMFLKEPDSSGTTERALAYGMLGGGAAVNPGAAAGVYGVANLYNRAGPSLTKRLVGTPKALESSIESAIE